MTEEQIQTIVKAFEASRTYYDGNMETSEACKIVSQMHEAQMPLRIINAYIKSLE